MADRRERGATAGDAKDDAVVARLDGVTFGYGAGRPVVRELTLAARRGRVLALLGPNGVGKTTVLRLLAGGLVPSAGAATAPTRVGVVPQRAPFVFAYTALDVVLTGRARLVRLFATPSARDEAAALAALARLGVASLAHRAVDTLSGGERQLVLIARALAAAAELLVLDEPTAALDLGHQQQVLRTLRQLVRDEGRTVVFTTHHPEHAAAVADDVALLFGDGQVVTGPAASVMTAERVGALFGVAVRRVTIAAPDGGATSELLVPVWDVDGPPPHDG